MTKGSVGFLVWSGSCLLFLLCLTVSNQTCAQESDTIQREQLSFLSDGTSLAGTIYLPKYPRAAVVIVHGSGQVERESAYGALLAEKNIAVLTYDKRGVGQSDGIYAGPEVGTNNIDSTNLNILATDANAAVKVLKERLDSIPIGLLGFSQAGWIMPIAAKNNPSVDFMVLFSCPLITTLEQLRFQFYTNGRKDFWQNHTEAEAREHVFSDPDKYKFITTDPKEALSQTTIPALWLFGEQDIQVPVKLCIEYLNVFKAQGKPYEYALFPNLGHNTSFASDSAPVDIAIQWIMQKSISTKKNMGKE